MNDSPSDDQSDSTRHEQKLRQLRAQLSGLENLQADSHASSSKPLTSSVRPSSPISEEDSQEQSRAAISTGFEVYSQVLTAALMMAIPAAAGYWIDTQWNLMLLGPIGIVVGIAGGVMYLVRKTKSH